MKYLLFDDKTWVVDIETDGLRPTLVWVLCAGNMMTGEALTITDMDEMREWVEAKRLEGCKFVMHNGLHFDGPVLNKLVGSKLSAACIVDSMILSMVYNPSLEGGHGLASWGSRLNYGKVEHEDWSVLSPEMIVRCQSDVELSKRTYGYICRKLNSIGFSEEGIALEHQAWVIVRKQQINGFHFDFHRAEEMRNELIVQADKLLAELARFFPATLECVRVYSSANNKDGTPSKLYLANKERYHRLRTLKDNTYEAWDFVPFDPASPDQRRDKLISLGWTPLEFTKPTPSHPEGQAQPTRKGKLSPSLQSFVDAQEEDNGIVTLIDWMNINSTISTLKTWMNAYNPTDECIHGQLWLANTLRYKHSAPNTANAPSVREGPDGHPLLGRAGGWAYECRDLWDTRDKRKRRLVGVDAKGIQLRVLANYLNDPDFTLAILSADPHSANQKKMGLLSRALTKTITYAVLMGAGDDRIALEARVTLAEAKLNKAKFFEQVPGLPKLIAKLKASQKKTGRIQLCDGSRILVDQQHTVIPYLLQGDESRIMKKAKVLADRMIYKQKLDVLWVGDIHDEWQCDVAEEDVEAFKAICVAAFKQAGESFKYNLPIECDAKVGLTWAETH
jgi:DNA polymerase-1